MFYIEKRMEIAGAHKLNLPYESKCSNIHGHNWIVTVWCRSEALNENGMVVDFIEIKKLIHDKLDHRYLNDVDDLGIVARVTVGHTQQNPTAERLSQWVCNQIPSCFKASVQESEGNIATYICPGVRND